jgi:hypothetical protein|uniref:Uncharacterized protein n=1 Tax=viral metagenome TaxID=1070528 RepID=A0A6C0BYZ1_9ZZZZ
MLNIHHTFILFLKRYFESVSIFYHLLFLCFLIWVKYFRDKTQKIPSTIVHLLGLYVIVYGFIIMYYGANIINGGLK